MKLHLLGISCSEISFESASPKPLNQKTSTLHTKHSPLVAPITLACYGFSRASGLYISVFASRPTQVVIGCNLFWGTCNPTVSPHLPMNLQVGLRI